MSIVVLSLQTPPLHYIRGYDPPSPPFNSPSLVPERNMNKPPAYNKSLKRAKISGYRGNMPLKDGQPTLKTLSPYVCVLLFLFGSGRILKGYNGSLTVLDRDLLSFRLQKKRCHLLSTRRIQYHMAMTTHSDLRGDIVLVSPVTESTMPFQVSCLKDLVIR